MVSVAGLNNSHFSSNSCVVATHDDIKYGHLDCPLIVHFVSHAKLRGRRHQPGANRFNRFDRTPVARGAITERQLLGDITPPQAGREGPLALPCRR